MSSRRRTCTITKLRQEDGVWKARVTSNGQTVDVDRSAGSWLASVRVRPGARTFERRELLPDVAAALQAKLPREEREPKVRKAVKT